MRKFEFYKNNEKIKTDNTQISFLPQNQILEKKGDDYIISLDFLNKTCEVALINENKMFRIEVIKMSCQQLNQEWILEYQLESEPDEKNLIKIIM